MPSVLFVCTANQCRSPMAEAIFRDMLQERGAPGDWTIGSAGVRALVGEPATLFTQSTLRERGIELRSHRSRPVTRDLLQGYNLVLTMEREQQAALQSAFPEMADRVCLLASMVDGDFDIDDPVGRPIEQYRALADELTDVLRRGMPRIERLAADLPIT